MPQFLVENFANGLDLRRSADTAPPGSLRVLRNCFINSGGEIEKRKAFVRSAVLSSYAQSANYRGRVTGPHRAAGAQDNAIFFRHRHPSLPGGANWPLSGTFSAGRTVAARPDLYIWAQQATAPLSLNYGALPRAEFVGAFGTSTHILEAYEATAATTADYQHFAIAHGTLGEPTIEVNVPDNDNRTAAIILRGKAYFASFREFFASAVNSATNFTGAGSGSVDVRRQSTPIGNILSLAEYYGQLVVMGQRGAQFWEVDPDFAKNQYLRTIPLSTVARRGWCGFGDGDVAYLGRDGIRSLRARDSSNFAGLSDFGSPIDSLVRAALDAEAAADEVTDGITRPLSEYFRLAIMTVHPETGHLWCLLKNQVYVYAAYPGAGVRAWSTFDLPAPNSVSTVQGAIKSGWVGDICEWNDDLVFRLFSDDVFVYGGNTGGSYDTAEAEVVTPFMDLGKPGTVKHFYGVELSCFGAWQVQVTVNSITPAWETIATVTNSTHRLTGIIPMAQEGTHIAVRLVSTDPQAARIGQLTVYYKEAGER